MLNIYVAVKHGRDISFHGLNFKYTDNRNGFQGYNEAMAAIEFHYCQNVTVTRCAFHHIGYNGVYTVATPSVTVRNQSFPLKSSSSYISF